MVHTIVSKVIDSLGRVSLCALKYRVIYDEGRSIFRWEKIPGQT